MRFNMLFNVIFCFMCFQKVHSQNTDLSPLKLLLNQTRRILRGHEAEDTRPYMVYLRPAATRGVSVQDKNANWLCGGVIIHSQYILTSAACIEDVTQFYVVSGTHKYLKDPFKWLPLAVEDECVKNSAKKAVWKCVPKDYVYDGKDFENIRWMIKDIAVVKVHEEFDFERRIRGCDFVPKMIAYNNQSENLEAPGSVGSISGWGSVDRFGDTFGWSTMNSPELLETDVVLISKKKCLNQWPERYHHIIKENMICAKDGVDADSVSLLCSQQEINCKELVYSDEEEDDQFSARRFILNNSQIHSPNHTNGARRTKTISGGFCENDHGGPLVVGHGKSSVVIGIISACMTANITQKCYGPFLYTSVWRNRHIISCAVEKDKGASCKKLLRSLRTRLVETKFDWPSLREGPNLPSLQTESSENSEKRQTKHVTKGKKHKHTKSNYK